MECSFILPAYCVLALQILNESGYEAYAVGGAVRDIIMNRIPHDFDIATSAMPDEIINVMKAKNIKTVDMAKKHGTITVIIDGNSIEITTYRIDGDYIDNRHPQQVIFTSTIDNDVARRDFTMNALYLDQNGQIVDLYNGIEDIRSNRICAVGEASIRFEEDALRIMRGLRFAAELGFNIEAGTEQAMFAKARLLDNISGERIYTEFTKLITAKDASRVIREYVDIISVFCPQILIARGFEQNSSYHDKDVLEHILTVLDNIPIIDGKRDETLAYAALFHDLGKPYVYKTDENGVGHMKGHALVSLKIWLEMVERLKIGNKLRDDVAELIKYHDTFPEPELKSVHRFMTHHSEENLNRLHMLQKADLAAHTAKAEKRVAKLESIMDLEKTIYSQKLPLTRKDLSISGKDLINAGLNPGVQMGEIIDKLLDAVIDGKVKNEPSSLITYALNH